MTDDLSNFMTQGESRVTKHEQESLGTLHIFAFLEPPVEAPQKEEIMINCDQAEVSPREQQVLNLLVQGCSNKEIGASYISVREL